MLLIRRSVYPIGLAAGVFCFAFPTATVVQQAPTLRDQIRDHPFGAPNGEVAALLNSEAVPELVAMLRSEEPYWGTVVDMLVVVGDERAVDALIGFVEHPVAVAGLSNLSLYEDARKRAIVGLGDLVRRTGSESALRYLIDGLTPNTWKKRNVRGVAQWTKAFEKYDLEEYESLLAEYAIYGLAHSGDPRAGKALRALQQSPTPEQTRFRNGLDNVLVQWLEIHHLVSELGLDGNQAFFEQQRRAAELGSEDGERPNWPDNEP
jgi:hypothetical protein